MRTLIFITMLTATAPVFAAELSTGSMLGKTSGEVTASLQEMGYEVRKIEREDGKIEVYFVKEDKMGEAYVDPATGKIFKLKMK